MKPLVTAIICTYNRSNYLQKAINSLLVQTSPIENYEILIIDNNSDDDTKLIVTAFQKYNSNIKYHFEPKQGLSVARNTGIILSEGLIIAFLDDDAIATSRWIEGILDVLNTKPEVGVTGGNIDIIWELERPQWLIDELLPFLGYLHLGDESRYLLKDEYFYGGNIVIRKSCLKSLSFNPKLGMQGRKISANEEIELEIALKAMGVEFYFKKEVHILHHARKELIEDKTWFKKRLFKQGFTNVQISNSVSKKSFYTAARKIIQMIFKPHTTDYPKEILIFFYLGFLSGYINRLFNRII